DSPIQGVKLFIRQMRIINRRNEEIQRFTRDLFQPISQILSLDPEPDGWTIASPADSIDPITRVKLGAPIVPVGMNHRNLLRCLPSSLRPLGIAVSFVIQSGTPAASPRPTGRVYTWSSICVRPIHPPASCMGMLVTA